MSTLTVIFRTCLYSRPVVVEWTFFTLVEPCLKLANMSCAIKRLHTLLAMKPRILVPFLIAFCFEGCLDGSPSAHVTPVEILSKKGTNFPNLLQLYFRETVYGPPPDWYQYFALPESEKSDQLKSVMGKVYFLMESELKTGRIKMRLLSHNSVIKLLAALRLLVQAQTVASSEMRSKLEQNAQAMFADIENSNSESSHIMDVGKMRPMCESSNTMPSIEAYCRKRDVESLIAWYMLLRLCINRWPRGTIPNMQYYTESCKMSMNALAALRIRGNPPQGEEYDLLVLKVYRNYMEAVDLVLYQSPSDQRDQRIMELVDTFNVLPEAPRWETYSRNDRNRVVKELTPYSPHN